MKMKSNFWDGFNKMAAHSKAHSCREKGGRWDQNTQTCDLNRSSFIIGGSFGKRHGMKSPMEDGDGDGMDQTNGAQGIGE